MTKTSVVHIRQMGRSFISLKVTIWIVMLIPLDVYAQGCERGWFGSSCQYNCHCTNNNCDNNGDCRDGDTCFKGWFGPQCQYVDLAYTANDGTTRYEFRDADDTTCFDARGQHSLTMSLNAEFPFTWLRLVSQDKLSPNIDVTFADSSGQSYPCNNKRSALVDSRTVDLFCDVRAKVKKIIVPGQAVGNLCSCYLSGGRNVALKQSQVSQSSTYIWTRSSFVASNAVDGNTDQNTVHGSCTHTDPNFPNPYWSVQFTQISDVNRYMLYNRGDVVNQHRLAGFVLTSFDQNGVQVFQHTDTETSYGLPVYDITTATNASSINRVNIIVHNHENILTLCEVEIFGDSHCPAGKYGRECDRSCNCASNEPCFVSTGGCPSGCASGYMGQRCDQPCQPGTYGQNCATTCSTYCQDQLKCDLVNGRCEECVSGKQGDLCNSNCPSTKHGPRCIHECSTNCYNQQCEGDTGTCIQCPAGRNGTLCDQDCPPNHYGPRCINRCSSNCVDGRCDGRTGRCIDCPPGKTGDECNLDCSPTTFGPRCIHNCSMNCLDNKCNGSSGVCVQCSPGKLGDKCDKDCPLGTYGVNCVLQCSTNCPYQRCAPTTGECLACKDGYKGLSCDLLCESGKYGQGCSKECSQFCNTVNGTRDNESPCHHVTGTCIYGCIQGYEGLSCESKKKISSSPSSSSTGLGVGLGIGLGVAALIVIIGVAIYCYRRRSRTQRSRRQRPAGYDPPEPTTDEHKYSDLFKSADDYTLPTDMVSSSDSPTSPPENISQDTVQYVNADVGHYEEIGHVTFNGESEGHYQLEIGRHGRGGKNNAGYANM